MSAKRVYAANLKYWLKHRKCSQTRLAQALGGERSTVSNWISARAAPDIDKAGVIAEFLKVPLKEFFEDPPYEAGDQAPLLEVSVIDYEKHRETVERLDQQKAITAALEHLGLEVRKKRKKQKKSL